MQEAETKTKIAEMDLLSFLEQLTSLKQQGRLNEAKAAVDARCETDLALFAVLYFPHYCQHPFNKFHREYFEDHGPHQRGSRRLYVAPRGSAKSTASTVIQCIHDLIFQREKFILIISNTQDQALQKLKDIRSELLDNDTLIQDYGPFFKTRMVGATEFIAHRGEHTCKFKAVGTGTEIRGVRHKESRPSKIIADDLEHSERVENEILRRKDAKYFYEVVSKVGSEKTNIEVVGTILHEDSLLQNLTKNAAYDNRQYKSIISWSEREDLWEQWRRLLMNLEDPDRRDKAQRFYEQNEKEMLRGTEVLWPEKEPYLYLMMEMLEIGKPAFMQEKQNEPVNPEDRVFSKIWWYQEENDGLRIEETGIFIPWKELKPFTFGALDPATGQTKPAQGAGPDFSCITVGYKHPRTNRIFVHDDSTKVEPPSKFIDRIFDFHARYEFQKFAVEINLYRNLLMQDIVRVRKEKENQGGGELLKIPFYEIENTAPKRQRIFALEPKVTHGWIVFNRRLSQEYMNQIQQFPNAAHDDAPDSLDQFHGLCNNKYPASPVSVGGLGSR